VNPAIFVAEKTSVRESSFPQSSFILVDDKRSLRHCLAAP